jgi:hypothetical protein
MSGRPHRLNDYLWLELPTELIVSVQVDDPDRSVSSAAYAGATDG